MIPSERLRCSPSALVLCMAVAMLLMSATARDGQAVQASEQTVRPPERHRVSIVIVDSHKFDDADQVLVLNLDPDALPGTTALISIERHAFTEAELRRGVAALMRVFSRELDLSGEEPMIVRVEALGPEQGTPDHELSMSLSEQVAWWFEILEEQMRESEQRRADTGIYNEPPPPPLSILGANRIDGLLHMSLPRVEGRP